MTDGSGETTSGRGLSRRAFLAGGSALGGLTVVGACTSADEVTIPAEGDLQASQRTPLPPEQTPAGVYEFFSPQEARTVEAVVARIIPGDEQDPGAREAGALVYIDAKLASFEHFAEPTYLRPPFAEGYTGLPPQPTEDTVPVAQDQLYRYGYQSGMSPQETYLQGLPALDRYSQTRFGAVFTALPSTQQDQVLEVLDAVQQRSEAADTRQGRGTGNDQQGGGPAEDELNAAEDIFGDVDPGAFFTTVRMDAIEGTFADPMYGGNRGMVGWAMVGFPGPQRAYSPEEMLHGARRERQSLDGLPPMNPGRLHQHGTEPMEKPREGVREG